MMEHFCDKFGALILAACVLDVVRKNRQNRRLEKPETSCRRLPACVGNDDSRPTCCETLIHKRTLEVFRLLNSYKIMVTSVTKLNMS